MSIFLDQSIHETTYKYKLPVNFPKNKLTFYPFAVIYYSKAITFLQIYPHLPQFTYEIDLKIWNVWLIISPTIRDYLT